MDPELYRDIVETSPDGIWVFDLDGRTIYANAALATLYGVTRREFMQMSVADTLDDEGRRHFADHLAALRRGELNDGPVEGRFLAKDGSRPWIEVLESGLYGPGGELTAVLHRVSDVSERRHALEELRSSRVRLDEAHRIARIGSWEWDYDRSQITGSTGLEEIYGWTPEEEPRDFEEFLERVHEEDRPQVMEAVASAGDTDSFVWVARVQGPDRWVWTRGRGLVRRDADGKAIGLSGTHQDITEVKEAELALVDQVNQNALMQAVASAANEAHTLHDVLVQAKDLVLLHDDWRRGRAFRVIDDGAGIEPIHLSEADRLEDLETPEDTALELALATEAMHRRATVWSEDRLTIAFTVAHAGTLHAVLTIMSDPPLYRHDMIQQMVEAVAVQIARVSEREEAQRVVADARDAAMAASRQKSEFLATMSHEIRTPLNGVIGLSDLLRRTRLDEEQQRLAAGVHVASRALLSVINDVLDFSKIEAGRLELEQVDFEVRPLLEQVESVLGDSAASKGILVDVRCDPSVPLSLCGDPTRLAQVLANLLSNAVKFTDAGSVTALATARIQGDRTELCVEVRDTGIGVAPATVPALFAPFTQADSSTTRLYGGTGLGLAISKEIVEAFGGHISYAPNLPRGSVFTFTAWLSNVLRGTPETSTPVGEPAPAVASPHGRRILVVEDNLVNQMVAAGLLEALGYAVEVAGDGVAALEVLADQDFDAVLMDVQMPKLDGYAATRALRAREGERRTPVIAMTAAAIDGERERCLEAGMDDFLTKPVDPAALGRTLTRWTGALPPGGRAVGDDEPVLPPTSPIDGLDVERLDMLRDLDVGNTDYLDRAISNFTARSAAAVETIRGHILEGDADLMRQAAHKLAGSALNLGVERSAAAARQLEWLGDSGTTDGALDLVPALERALEEGRALLRAYQDSYGGPGAHPV
ncbi:ATP-binding protein [Nocardioides sp. cx-173]|uniref:ATP-binding protein n=1 Tax=Nocardioides sp. cx-173 TaxID=2898796 RepID=UPI001E44BA76|nr:ATP-binding protein [Nocardioides sp. cx-173]MCD4527465.1 ATP-binding protein [Nocardioides sp. cx-173]UGB40395.1 ATP-binding protein [Nocardioides sp. cx-173]